MESFFNLNCCDQKKSATKETLIKKEMAAFAFTLEMDLSNNPQKAKYDFHTNQTESLYLSYIRSAGGNNADVESQKVPIPVELNGMPISEPESLTAEDRISLINNDEPFHYDLFTEKNMTIQSGQHERKTRSRASSISVPDLTRSRSSSLHEAFVMPTRSATRASHLPCIKPLSNVDIISDETLTEKDIKESWVNFP
jgi:hypothetical protein